MPRARAILQSEFPYHITARCINREWFNVPMDKVWKIFCEELTRSHDVHNLQIHSFVLMSNHFHLIASTPEANISQAMHQFMYRSSKSLTRLGNRINQTFAGRHYKCVLQEHSYFMNAYKYNYRNPVAAGLCSQVEEYEYSSLPMVLNRMPRLLPLVDDTLVQEDPVGILRWLNTTPDPEKLDAVKMGLRRQLFVSKKSKLNNKYILSPGDLM